MYAVGVTPIIKPIRGGTDGARLTEMGVPCPNLFTGMQEVHSQREWVSLQDMTRGAEVLLHLADHLIALALPDADLEGVVDGRELRGELDVDDGADDLNDFAFIHGWDNACAWAQARASWAVVISSSSLVIAA